VVGKGGSSRGKGGGPLPELWKEKKGNKKKNEYGALRKIEKVGKP